MSGQSPSEKLAELLMRLKESSGHSYEWIGRKVHASKSTVHRYCTGYSVPSEFGPLEQIARACNASRDDIARLYRLWELATITKDAAAGRTRSGDQTRNGEDRTISLPAGTAPGAVVPASSVSRRFWIRRAPVKLIAGVLGVLAMLSALTASQGRPPVRAPSPPVQSVTGPTWTLPAQPVPRTLFGVTLNSSTGAMPTFRVGAVRLWDSDTRWADLEPQRGRFDWSVLDRLVAGAARAGVPALFVVGGTPRWASPAGAPAAYPDGSRAAPPDALADWDTFVRAVVERYRRRIEAYELWVMANDRHFYVGSISTLVEMTRRASRIIRAVDPAAVIVCPGMGQLWSPAGRAVLQQFAELGGYDSCDVAGIKLHQQRASDPPETMLDLLTATDQIFHQAGVQPRLWNTGTTYSLPLQGALDETTARNFAVRFFLVGLYGRYLNLERMYFYNWGGGRIPIVLQAEGGAPTQAALFVEELQRWLAAARLWSCGHGLANAVPSNVWQCRFFLQGDAGTENAVIRWTDGGQARVAADAGAFAVRHLDGHRQQTAPGAPLLVTEEPILIESRPPAPPTSASRSSAR